MAWHLEQWVASSECPRLRSALSCADARAAAIRLNTAISSNRAIGIRSSGLGIVATAGLRAGIPDSLHQGIAQERLFHDRNVGACSTPRQLRCRVARDQDRRRQNRLFPQLEDKVQAGNSRQSLVDDQAAAARNISFPQQFRAVGIETDAKALDFERKLERIAHGRIIVDDDDNGLWACQIALRIHCLRLRRLNRGGALESIGIAAAALMWLNWRAPPAAGHIDPRISGNKPPDHDP